MNGIYKKEFELGINEVDKNNKMKLSTCLKLMQEIGALHSKEYGYCLDTEKSTHKAWVVLAWKLEIFNRPSWNQKIYASTWISKMDKIYFYRNFEMKDSEGNIIAKATSQWIMIDTVTKKIEKITEELLNLFIKLKVDGYEDTLKKPNLKFDVSNLEEIYDFVVQKRDLDTNNHMNNIVYLDLAMEGLDDEFCDSITNIEIYYKSECKVDEKIVFMKSNEDNVYVLDSNKEKLHTLIKFKKGERNG